MVICNVAKILELVVPLMDHPSENFLTTMEEDLMKLIIKYGMTVSWSESISSSDVQHFCTEAASRCHLICFPQVVQHCVSCLGAVVNKVTHNFKFVWSCFNRYYGEYISKPIRILLLFSNPESVNHSKILLLPCEGALNKLKLQHQEDSNSTVLASNKPALLRSLFTVGALCRHFDFDQEEFKGSNKVRSSVTGHDFWIIKVLRNIEEIFVCINKSSQVLII